MTEENGMLMSIPGTHTDGRELFYIPDEEIAKQRDRIRPFPVQRGDALFFHMKVWHRRAPGGPGRRVVRISYRPQSAYASAFDLVLRQSFLEGLSSRQLRALGIGGPAFGVAGYFRHVGREFKKSDVRDLLVYARRFRRTRFR